MDASRRMPQSATFGPGAGFLPFWLGALMAILSVLLIVQAFRRPPTPGEKPAFPGRKSLVAVGEAVAGLALYILLLERLGFLIGTGLLTAYLLGVVERETWRTTLLVAVLNSVGLFCVFGYLLGVRLPRNMFGF